MVISPQLEEIQESAEKNLQQVDRVDKHVTPVTDICPYT